MICEFRGKLKLRNFSLIESSWVLDLFRDKTADTETDMEQIGAQEAKEQEQNYSRWSSNCFKPKTMVACIVCAYACTCACHLLDGMPTQR
jgi:hypothetical protein